MNYRELLELAAKAAGYEPVCVATGGYLIVKHPGGGPESSLSFAWNPLENDGDALRLANQLKFCVCHTLCEVTKAHGTVMVGYTPWENTAPIATERYTGTDDRDQAVRRAITH